MLGSFANTFFNNATQKTLEEKIEELRNENNALNKKEKEFGTTKMELLKAKENLTIANNKLKKTKHELNETQESLSNTRERLINTKKRLSITKEQLSNSEECLSNTIEELEHELKKTKDELKKTQESLSNTKKLLSNTKEQLSNSEESLSNTRDELQKKKAKHQEKKKKWSEMEEKLRQMCEQRTDKLVDTLSTKTQESDKKRKAESEASTPAKKTKRSLPENTCLNISIHTNVQTPPKSTTIVGKTTPESQGPTRKKNCYKKDYDILIATYCLMNNITKCEAFFDEKHVSIFISSFKLDLAASVIITKKQKLADRIRVLLANKKQKLFLDIMNHFQSQKEPVSLQKSVTLQSICSTYLQGVLKGFFNQEILPFLVFFITKDNKNIKKIREKVGAFLQDDSQIKKFIEYFGLDNTIPNTNKPYLSIDTLKNNRKKIDPYFPEPEQKKAKQALSDAQKKEKEERLDKLDKLFLAALKAIMKLIQLNLSNQLSD